MTEDPYLYNERIKLINQTKVLVEKVKDAMDEIIKELDSDEISIIKCKIAFDTNYENLKSECESISERCFKDKPSHEIGKSIISLHQIHTDFFHMIMDLSGFTYSSEDNISALSRNVSKNMNCDSEHRMKIVPAVTNMLLYYRNNAAHHNSKPFVDPLTGIQVGHVCNVYMLSAITMFTAYSILELLMTWAGFMDIELSYDVYNAFKNE